VGGYGDTVDRRRQPPRVMPWIAAPAALGIALTLLLVFKWGGEGTVRVIDNLTLLILSVYATGCAASAARSAHGRSRRAWMTMVVALGAWATGNVVWTYNVLALQRAPFPSPANFCYLAFPLLAALAMVQLRTGPTRRSRLRLVLDGVTVALCLSLLTWVLALHEVYNSYREGQIALGFAVLYPVVGVLVLTVAVGVLVRAEARQRAVLWLLTAAIGVMVVAQNAFAYLVAGGRYDTGDLIDIGWAVSLILFAAAALLSRQTPALPRPAGSVPSNSSLWLPYVPLLLAGTVGPAIVMSGLESILVPLIVVTVVLRQSVAAWENRRLLSAAADQALRDPLTGLGNRTLFHDRLDHAMMLRQREDRGATVVSLDLDDFKLVNDSLGHPTADALLVCVGQRIADCVRPGDTVARLGGDEFALLLEGPADDSHLVAETVVDAFNEPFVLDGQEILVRPSLGMAVASSTEPELTSGALLKRADIAMYAAKRSRTSGVHTYSPDMTLVDPDVVEFEGSIADRPAGDGASQVRLFGELRHAIDHGALDVVYQPKQDLRTKRIVGVEALLRWPHPHLGVLRPDAFMSLVRQHGLMRPVTNLVLHKALDDAARWASLGVPTPVAVNLFAPFLRDTALPDTLSHALAERDLAADVLTVEITEDMVLSDVGLVVAVLRRLRGHGIRVAIDDFGSGYSALSYLRDLPMDEVKLDSHFIASVTRDVRAAAVVRAVIDLTHNLGITVVAEGVEDADTAGWLREHGCDIGQGYLFGRPVPAAAITQLITAGAAHARPSKPAPVIEDPAPGERTTSPFAPQ